MIFAFLLLFFLFSEEDRIHRCIHDEIAITEFRKSNSTRRSLLRIPRVSADFDTIRIHFDTETNLDSDLSSSPIRLAYIKDEILPLAKDWIEKLLKTVHRSEVQVPRSSGWCADYWSNGKCKTVNTEYCGIAIINEDHLEEEQVCVTSESNCETVGGGVQNTDYILYVSAQNDECSSGVLAFASACLIDTFYENPIVGYINLCPLMVDPTETENEKEQYVHIVVHEIFHALGFSSSFFDSFMYHDGMPRFVITKEFEERGETTRKFVTKNTLKAAQEHFNCPTLNGLEIEEEGGSGTALSHTEQRIFRNDFMNPFSTGEPKFSVISLAIMEDSGWYKAKFENAEPLFFGKDAGCDFALDACLSGDKSDPTINGPEHHFCKTPNELQCTPSRYGVGICKMATFSDDLPSNEQYFTDSTVGGVYATMSYCPYYEIQQTTNCLDSENLPIVGLQLYGEVYGDSARCFESSLRNDGGSVTDSFKCYNVSCDLENEIAFISLSGGAQGSTADRLINCSKAECDLGTTKTVEDVLFWTGTLTCPSFDSICPKDQVFQPDSEFSNLWIVLGVGVVVVGIVICIILLVAVGVGCWILICGSSFAWTKFFKSKKDKSTVVSEKKSSSIKSPKEMKEFQFLEDTIESKEAFDGDFY